MATEIYLGNPPENIKKWIKENYKSTTPNYLCFTAEEAGSTITMVKEGDAPTVYLETSPTGEEGSWTDFTVCTLNEDTYEANNDGTIITLPNVGDKVYFRAKQDNERFATSIHKYNWFVMSGKIAASGNLNTLLKADGSILDLTGRDYCYYRMFYNCTSLTQAPELPATKLATYCYQYMFHDCTSLTQAPELPATTLVGNCYAGMFYGCSSLTQAPELPATTLADQCYGGMFEDCTSLTQAPELPAMTLADWCYVSMFYNCTSLTKAPELPTMTLAEGCYYSMFYNCKSPFTFPNKTFDEVANLIQEQILIGESYWHYYDEEYNKVIINPIEIICSDKTMLATYDENEYAWTLTEK